MKENGKICKLCNKYNTPDTIENLRSWPGKLLIIGECECGNTIAFKVKDVRAYGECDDESK